MKNLRPFIIVIFIFVFSLQYNSYSKNRLVIDSLKRELQNSKKGIEKVDLLDQLAKNYSRISMDTFQMFSEQALKQAKKLNYKKGMANAYNKIAIAYFDRRDFKKSLMYYNEQFKISEELGDKTAMAKFYRNVGLVNRQLGEYDKAIENFLMSLEIRINIDDKDGITACYNDLGSIYNSRALYKKALEYFTKSLELRKELGDKEGVAMNYYNIGTVKRSMGLYEEALEYLFKSLKIKEELGNEIAIASNYSNIGLVYKAMGEYDTAIEYYMKSLNIAEKLGSEYGMAVCFSNIGNIHKNQGSQDKALEYFQKSLKIAENLNLKNGMVVGYNNIGIIFNNKENYIKALEYYNKSLKIAKELGDLEEVSNCYINIGSIYKNRGDNKKALEYYLNSLKIKEEIGEKKGIAIAYSSITSLYVAMADSVTYNNRKTSYLNKAVEYGKNAYSLAKEIQALPQESEASKFLFEAYNKLGSYKKAMKFAEVYIATKDSLFNKDKAETIQEMETKYETEKKNVEIKELKIKDLENENIKRLFILIIIFLGIISILLFFFFRQKVKTNKVLDKKNYQLNKLNETQSRLMSIISHDLKAPLSAFFSITSSLKSKIDKMDSKAIDEYFNRMLNSALAVKLQLENLLVWSITQTTDINVHKNAYNLSIIVQKVIVILEEFSNEKSIAIDNKVDENIEINTDGRLLSIVLNNITTNAIKFSDKNSNVEIEATKSNGKMRITVKDYGCGMSNENLRNLFDGKNSMKHANKGTGLGLIVCKDIVDKLGGKIWAESEEGKGTTFYIEIDE